MGQCISDECEARSHARGLCNTHYSAAWKAGELQPLQPPATWHRLTEVDAERREGVCSICGPVSVRDKRAGRGYECMTKRLVRGRDQQRATGARRRARYGLTPEDVLALLHQQNWECPVCLRGIEPGSACVDHDHACCPGRRSCGRCVRGLLCRGCNTWLGRWGDEVARLERAIQYLETARTRQNTPLP